MRCFTQATIFFFLATYWCDNVQTLFNDNVSSMYKLWRIINISQNVVTASTSQQDGLVSCSFQCDKLGFISFYYIKTSAACLCSLNEDINIDGHETDDSTILYGIRKTRVLFSSLQEDRKTFNRIHKQPEPVDCLAFYRQGYTEDGVYVIKPTGSTATDVWCDMTNGGWTVIQRRQDGSEDFYRNLEDYKNGFGNRSSEYWLGLEEIYYLTIIDSSIYIYLETFQKDSVDPFNAFAEYSTFKINDESDKYRLTVAGYNGSCGDSMSYHNGSKFTTKDDDNDSNFRYNCAVTYTGAWWYNSCHFANLNGLYLDGAGTKDGGGINWYKCWGHTYSLKKTEMKVRRNI